eukprot:CAMPEP_0204616774 /NCGR_PEP_ID=MMETSP0717-20131115/3942_1 /ASSEMBLY_ACC=CAM_ASM_000666 /TAXON_ID=230516 /ORGANISM="Chaetoceros curvisetus" /LENGTH=288 /DNA_ID=CAMNT_0051630121 /DNA_START=32 /DNA_END=898 /DNA_ORIENTATION=-
MNLSHHAISFLTADFEYSAEFQCLFMAIQGAMIIRNGPNKDQKMKWFHAFAQGLVTAYAGGLLAPLWMGRPSAILSNDLCVASCIIAFVLVNYIPGGYNMLSLFPLKLLTVMGAQLFRARGIVSYVNIAYNAFKEAPSKYYPTPVFGPILNACILGNMGAFFWKGFHGHLQNGMPFPFQNGLLVASSYHFVANDEGPVGDFIRSMIVKLPLGDLDTILFVTVMGSLFMQTVGILQMPEFMGPSFNPFNMITAPFSTRKSKTLKNAAHSNGGTTKKKKRRKNKSKTKNE